MSRRCAVHGSGRCQPQVNAVPYRLGVEAGVQRGRRGSDRSGGITGKMSSMRTSFGRRERRQSGRPCSASMVMMTASRARAGRGD
eukprot:573663-Prymnesium_polylepis.1